MQNFHRELRQSDYDVRTFVMRKATKHDRLSPLIEAAILEAPLLSPHQQYLSFCEAHPTESLSEDTFRRYANEIEGLKIVRRVRQLVNSETHSVETSRDLSDVLACDRLSEAKRKEIVEVFPKVAPSRSDVMKRERLRTSSVRKKLLVVFLFACNVSQDVLSLLMGVSKSSIHYWIADICTDEFEGRTLRELTCWSGKVCR